MRLSSAILLDALGTSVTAHNISREQNPWVFGNLAYPCKEERITSDTVCLVAARDYFPGIASAAGLIVLTDWFGDLPDDPRPTICCSITIEAVDEIISFCFMKWAAFEEQAKTMLFDNPSLEEYIEHAANFLQLPMTVIDNTMRFICRSSKQCYVDYPDYVNAKDAMRVPDTLIDQLSLRRELSTMLEQREVVTFKSDVMYSTIIIANFYKGDCYMGRISACDGRPEYSQGMLDSVEYVRRHVLPFVERYTIERGPGQGYHEGIIMDALLSSAVNLTLVTPAMAAFGFREGAEFACVYIRITEDGLAEGLKNYYVEMLRNRFDWPCILPVGGDVIGIFPYEDSKTRRENLHKFLCDNDYLAGFSESFRNYADLPKAFLQAREAAMLSPKADSCPLRFYKETAISILIEKNYCPGQH